jgi:hypothetical protein
LCAPFLFVQGACFILLNPDANQLTRDIMPLGKRIQAFPGNELLRDLPLELNAVGTLSGLAGIYRRRITAASSQEIARYISEDTMARMVIPVITMFILKIWHPRAQMLKNGRVPSTAQRRARLAKCRAITVI